MHQECGERISTQAYHQEHPCMGSSSFPSIENWPFCFYWSGSKGPEFWTAYEKKVFASLQTQHIIADRDVGICSG